MKKISCFIFILITSLAVKAQSKKTDSLRSLLVQEKTDTGRMITMLKLGNIYRSNRNDSALIYYQEALQLSENAGIAKFEIEARSVMATYMYNIKADYAAALDMYLQNIKLEEQTRDTSNIILDIRGVLNVYEKIGDFSKTLEYLNKIRDLTNSELFKNNSNLALYKLIVWFRLGILYDEMNKPDSAKHYLLRTYNYGESKKWGLTSLANAGGVLGRIYWKQKQPDSALYYYRASLSAAQQIARLDIYAETQLGLANFYWQNKQADSAFSNAIRSYNLTKKIHDNDNMIGVAALLGEIYYARKQTDSAYLYLSQSVKLKDSLLGADKISRIQDLATKEKLKKIEQEQTRKEAVREYKSRIRIYSLLAGLAILSLFLFILYRSNLQRRAANIKIGKAYEDLKSTQTQLIQSEKMASLGELTAGIAHEIQNPLNFVNNFSDVNREMLEELKAESAKPRAERDEQLEMDLINDLIENEVKINHHGKRADGIVKGMLEHSRTSTGQKESTDLNKLADEYLRLAYHGFRAKDKTFNTELITNFDEKLPVVNVIPQDIGRVLLNLYNNAFYAVNQKQKNGDADYKPEVSVNTSEENGNIIIKVKDNGVGVPNAIREKIMQPFFTTKPTGEGTGLGLSLSYDIVVKGHGGNMTLDTVEGEYSVFIITLPLL
jgi:signal transduction histidine kinase